MKIGLLGHLYELANVLGAFVLATFVPATFVPVSVGLNISANTQLISTKLGHKFFQALYFFGPLIFYPKFSFFLPKN